MENKYFIMKNNSKALAYIKVEFCNYVEDAKGNYWHIKGRKSGNENGHSERKYMERDWKLVDEEEFEDWMYTQYEDNYNDAYDCGCCKCCGCTCYDEDYELDCE